MLYLSLLHSSFLFKIQENLSWDGHFQPQHAGGLQCHCHYFLGSSSWWGGPGYYCLSFLASLYGFISFALCVFPYQKNALEAQYWCSIKKDSNKGKPQSAMDKGYLELWELSTYQRQIAKLLFWLSFIFYAELFASVLTVSLRISIKLVNFTWFLYEPKRSTQWQFDSV